MIANQNFETLQRRMAQQLAAAGLDTAALDARVLLEYASRLSATELAMRARDEAPSYIQAETARLVAVRCAGQPVAKIIGYKEFWGRRFKTGPSVLDPRPDSETLIEAALALLPDTEPRMLIDLGTGSGCLVVTLLAERPAMRGIGIDKSAAAVSVARANAHRLGVRDRIALRRGDWLHGVAPQADMIISNPPYIKSAAIAGLQKEVRLHDPRAALDGGADGLEAYRRLIGPAHAQLKKDGHLLLEIGATQAAAVTRLMRQAGFVGIACHQDLAGRDRLLLGQKKS